MDNHLERKTLEFAGLPLIEVALKRVITPHVPVNLPMVLRLARDVGSRFSHVLDLEHVEQPPGSIQGARYDIHTTGGCRLIEAGTGITVTVQRDLLTARWSRTDIADYPRFPALQGALDAVMASIRAVNIGDVRTCLVNVAYANRVDNAPCQVSSNTACWPIAPEWTPPALTSVGQPIEQQTVFRGANGIEHRLSLVLHEGSDESAPWYLLLTVGGKRVEQDDDELDVELAVHDSLMDWFPSVLSKDALAKYEHQL